MPEQENPTINVSTGNPKHVDGLDISPAEDGYIVYQPEQDRVHYLNATAVLILELCNGRHSTEQIVQLVKDAYQLPEAPAESVHKLLAQMKSEGLCQ